MRQARFLALAGVLLLAAACADPRQPTAPLPAPAAGGFASAPSIRVMTRNMYLGADIDPLLAPGATLATALPAALAQLQHTDYPARAQYLALEIATRLPDAVGLQEATHYTIVTPAGTQQVDWVDILQAYLAGMGVQYDVAVRQSNVSLTFPVGFGGITAITYTDGDAILVRHGVPWSDPAAGHYPTQALLSALGFTFPNLRGWNAVTLSLGTDYRFFNTHLEIQSFRTVQEQQARELAALIDAQPLPVLLVGDFNSAANPGAPDAATTDTYHILRNDGFQDLALRAAHSAAAVTCCHLADLSDAVPTFDQRLDLVFARFGNAGFGGQADVEIIANDRFLDPQGYYLWPSDHAGVFARIWPAPGLVASH